MILIILALLLIPSLAFAAAGSTDTLDGWLQTVLDATAASNWKAVVALGLMGAVIGLRALADWRKWTFLSSGIGAVASSVLLGVATTVSSGALAGSMVGLPGLIKAVFEGVLLASSSSGGYSWWKTYKASKQDV